MHTQIVSRAAQTVGDFSDVTNVRQLSDPRLDEAAGRQSNRQIIQKFGENPDVAVATQEEIWDGGGTYPGFLQAAVAVRVKAGGNANDTAAGTGARTVVVVGLDQNWDNATETLTLAGASASSPSTTTFIRVYVEQVGTYGGSNAAAIVIETTGGVTVAQISMDGSGTGNGQTQMAIYTVPAGKIGFIRRIRGSTDGTKAANLIFWRRNDADNTSTPRSKRIWHTKRQFLGSFEIQFDAYPGPFPAKTDIWVSSVGATGGSYMSAGFDVVLIDAV